MKIEPTELPEVIAITPRRFGDERGWFQESWSAQAFAQAEIAGDWVQDNHSYSAAAGTLRGLHFQSPPSAQAKLVRCTRGAIWDVAVDFRTGSPRWLQWAARELSAENGVQLYVPAGFLHGFVTLTADCEVQYKCSASYDPACDGAVRWDDPAIAIAWPVAGADFGALTLSDKDRAAPLVSEIASPFEFAAA